MSDRIHHSFLIGACSTTILLSILITYYNHKICAPLERYLYTIEKQETVNSPIQVGLYIDTFETLDLRENDVSCVGAVWFVYNPQKFSRDHITDFSFYRCETQKESATFTTISETQERAVVPVKIRMRLSLDFTFYPFDDHNVDLILINKHIPPATAGFVTSSYNFAIQDSTHKHGWKYYAMVLSTGTIAPQFAFTKDAIEQKMCVAQLRLSYNRINPLYGLFILIPLLFFVFLSLWSFSYPVIDSPSQHAGTTNAGIATFFSWRFALGGTVPSVEYFTILDYLFYLWLLVALCAYITATIATQWQERSKKIFIAALLLIVIVSLGATDFAMKIIVR